MKYVFNYSYFLEITRPFQPVIMEYNIFSTQIIESLHIDFA